MKTSIIINKSFNFIILSAICILGFSSNIYAQLYKESDDKALNTPSQKEKSIELLSNHLAGDMNSDKEIVRAFYTWITHNINYDTESFFSNNSGKRAFTAENTLRSRKSVCQGYAELFKALCEVQKISCYIVDGYAKGYGYNGNMDFNNSNHAWNTVKLSETWYLIDATWGAGYVDNKRKFVKQFDEKYFLTSPDIFILNHLPSDPMWQLLYCPVSINQYSKGDDNVKAHLNRKDTCFNYNDTIHTFIYLSDTEQLINSAERAFRFNPQNTEIMGYAYVNLAFEIGESLPQLYDKQDYKKALETNEMILKLNKKALKQFSLSSSAQAKNATNTCKQNIKNTEKNIEQLKKAIKQ